MHAHTGYGTTTPKDKSRQLQRKLCLSAKGWRAVQPDLMWQVLMGRAVQGPECLRKKVVGEPYEGKPHVRFEVAGDGNQDVTSQAPSPDPTVPCKAVVC